MGESIIFYKIETRSGLVFTFVLVQFLLLVFKILFWPSSYFWSSLALVLVLLLVFLHSWSGPCPTSDLLLAKFLFYLLTYEQSELQSHIMETSTKRQKWRKHMIYNLRVIFLLFTSVLLVVIRVLVLVLFLIIVLRTFTSFST